MKIVNEFAGKHAIVTGAGSGIGRSTAMELAERGVVLTIIDRDSVGLEKTAAMAKEKGARPQSHLLDVSDSSAVNDTMQRIERERGAADYLVNGAGAFFSGPIETVSDEKWQHCFAVNMFGLFYVCRACSEWAAERIAVCGVEGRSDGFHEVAGAGEGGKWNSCQYRRPGTDRYSVLASCNGWR
jgi:NAD(P)-dependent dehydrogenase (short-subunit alcohol dehydrogenase family)